MRAAKPPPTPHHGPLDSGSPRGRTLQLCSHRGSCSHSPIGGVGPGGEALRDVTKGSELGAGCLAGVADEGVGDGGGDGEGDADGCPPSLQESPPGSNSKSSGLLVPGLGMAKVSDPRARVRGPLPSMPSEGRVPPERPRLPLRLPMAAEVMCGVQHEKTWSSGQRGCILRPCQGQNGNPGL